jgi:butyrate kinase
MYLLEQKIDEQIFKIDKPRPTLIFPEATDQRVIFAAAKLANLVQLILLADKDSVYQILKESNQFSRNRIDYFMNQVKLIDHQQEKEKKKIFANELSRISHGLSWEVNYQQALKLMDKANYFAILATRLGYADAVLGGLTMTITDFFSPCLQILEKDRTVFEMAIFALPVNHPEEPFLHHLAIFSDIAVNAVMDAEKLSDIAVETCRLTCDIIPATDLAQVNGAIVSYSTKGSASGPSVEMVREAGDKIPLKIEKLVAENSDYKRIKIESELQISAALSVEEATFKLKDKYRSDSPVGKANVLIAPNLDLGNFLYHLYALRYPDSKKVVISGGLRNQAVDFSRSSTVEDIILGTKALTLCLKKDKNYAFTPNDAFFPRYRVLIINPGSTSTKIAIYKGEIEELKLSITHSSSELAPFEKVAEQLEFRKKVLMDELKKHGLNLQNFDGIVGRGGLVKPLAGGTYSVNENMKDDLRAAKFGEHASNLGALIASGLAAEIGKDAYIVDPVGVDEMSEKAKVTGFKEIKRKSLWHALNQRSVAKNYALSIDKLYEEVNLIVAHLGGGITVGAHIQGKTVDVNDGVHGDGPFSPERSGQIPVESFMKLMESNQFSPDQMCKKIHGKGGLVDLVGTNDLREVEKKIAQGEEFPKLILDALIYNICKEITSLLPAFEGGPVDAILITGGLAFSNYLVSEIQRYLSNLNIPIRILAGEKEMEALRNGILKVLRGEEKALEY